MDKLSELSIQTLFRSRARIICPSVHIVAVPNAGKRTRWAASQVKREGLAAGFPDVICLFNSSGAAVSAYIEFKSAKGRLSENQKEWIERLEEMGFPVLVSRDADHALDWLISIGAPHIKGARNG